MWLCLPRADKELVSIAFMVTLSLFQSKNALIPSGFKTSELLRGSFLSRNDH